MTTNLDEMKTAGAPASPGSGQGKRNRNKNKNGQRGGNIPGAPNKSKAQIEEERKSKKEDRDKWLEGVREKGVNGIKEGTARAVSTLCQESEDGSAMMTANDFLVNKLRRTLGRPGGISFERGMELLKKNEELYLQFNMINMELAEAVKGRYTPPFRYRGQEATQASPASPVAFHVVENPPLPEKTAAGAKAIK
jgi:hypothetical protein